MQTVKTLMGTYRVGGGVINPTPAPKVERRVVKTEGRTYSQKVRVYAAPSTPRGKRRAAQRAGK